MNFISVLSLIVFVTTAADQRVAEPDQSAAIVSALSGTARVTGSRGSATVACFDWIGAGSHVEVGSGSRLVLVLVTGQRFELLAGSKATVTRTGLTKPSGEIREIAAVPALPRVDAIAARAQPGATAAGIRVRGDQINAIYPSVGAVTLADRTVLSFAPVKGASRYRVRVDDERGRSVLTRETDAAEVAIPTGQLRPGTPYYWHVETLDRFGAAARGASEFITLSTETERQRAALTFSLEADRTPRSLALLGEIDRKLGLVREARERLRQAAAMAPEDVEIREALRRVERQLGDSGSN